MYFMTVNYPVSEDTHFDQSYYLNKHLPLVKQLFLEYGLSAITPKTTLGYAPGSRSAFYASVDLIFDSLASLKTALTEQGAKVSADVKNYTNVEPSYLFGELIEAKLDDFD